MAEPELLITPATPTSHSSGDSSSRVDTTSTSTFSSDSQPSSTLTTIRSSSEDTAVTIFSMYGDTHDPKLAALNEDVSLESNSKDSSPHSSIMRQSPSTTLTTPLAQSRSYNGDSKPDSRPHSQAIGVEYTTDYRHSIASSHRASMESSSLPYTRNSIPLSPDFPPPTPPPKLLSDRLSRRSLVPERPQSTALSLSAPPSRSSLAPPLKEPSLVDQERQLPSVPSDSPLLQIPGAGPSKASLPASQSRSIHTARSEGEDADSFHVRATYAQLDAQGVDGDGIEEGVELTRAKQHGTEYLTASMRQEPLNRDFSAKEAEVLATVDRYGFYADPSSHNDRALLLPSSSLLKHLSRIPPSKQRQQSPSIPARPPQLADVPQSRSNLGKEMSRVAKWGRMLQSQSQNGSGNVLDWRIVPRKERKFRARVYKGVPDAWRAAAWAVTIERVAGAAQQKMDMLAAQYWDALEKPSTFDIQIDLDVPRTISGHVMFRTRYGHGQRSLFHVLHAFSLVCGECGYVQGMGPLAATLLCYFEPEKVYGIMVHLHDAYGMHEMFKPGFPGLLEAIYVMERVMERMMPDVYASFKRLYVSSTSYTTKWFITLFANCVPFQTQLRLWDAFFYEGKDVLVLIAVAIIWVFKTYLTSPSANFETVLSLLSSYFVPESEDVLLKWIEHALGDQKLRADMSRWREEWQQLVREKKDRDVLL